MKFTPYSVFGSVAIFTALLCTAVPSMAVTIEVEYSAPTPVELTCSPDLPPALCDPSTLYGSSPTSSSLAFDLAESQRSVNGSYDVSSFLSGTVWDSYQSLLVLPGLISASLTANAITQGGLVIDVLLNYGYSFLIEEVLVESSLTGSSGTYGSVGSMTFNALSGSTIQGVASGEYVITQPPSAIGPIPAIPEPEIYAMMGMGLGLMGFMARRRKKQAA